MTDIIDRPTLVTYLGSGATAVTNDQLDLFVELANGIVTDAWKNPTGTIPSWVTEASSTDRVPAWVTAITLEVAARPARNPKGLSSVTRHVDDASRTERLSDRAAQAGVFLTADEERRLAHQGKSKRRDRFGTVRVIPGY